MICTWLKYLDLKKVYGYPNSPNPCFQLTVRDVGSRCKLFRVHSFGFRVFGFRVILVRPVSSGALTLKPETCQYGDSNGAPKQGTPRI